MFLNELAYTCDYDKGGDSHRYWIKCDAAKLCLLGGLKFLLGEEDYSILRVTSDQSERHFIHSDSSYPGRGKPYSCTVYKTCNSKN
jgi:hypothetical protein